jgi:hypothetical protein
VGVLAQEVTQRIAVAAAHVTELRDAREVVGFQGFQHQACINAGVPAHGLIEDGPIARVLDRIIKLGLPKLPDKAALLPFGDQRRLVLPRCLVLRAIDQQGDPP